MTTREQIEKLIERIDSQAKRIYELEVQMTACLAGLRTMTERELKRVDPTRRTKTIFA